MDNPTIFGIPQADILAETGTALLQVKCDRHLTLEDMGRTLGRTDDMVAKYIAGEAEMGFVAFRRALEAWPELAAKLTGTAS